MPVNLLVQFTAQAYAALLANPSPSVAAAQRDPLFVFDPANLTVGIDGEYRELGASAERRVFRDLLSPDLRNPEVAIATYATAAYKALCETRRDQARADLSAVAVPGGPPTAPPPPGLTGDMDSTQASCQVLGTAGGLVLGYQHTDQSSKGMMTGLIEQAGGTELKHVFIEEISSGLQNDINAFMADPAAVLSDALETRLAELRKSYSVDFEALLHAARAKGVKVWGIDTPAADPQVEQTDPRYHERRLAIMNAEAKRVFDHVQQTYPGEPFLAGTGLMHLNTADGGVPGLAQIMGVPGFVHDAKTNRLAFQAEDISKRVAPSTAAEQNCADAILAKAKTDYKAFVAAYPTSADFAALPDPKPAPSQLTTVLVATELLPEVQRLTGQLFAAVPPPTPATLPGLIASPAITGPLEAFFKVNVLRSVRQAALNAAIETDDVPALRAALAADPRLIRVAESANQKTWLHSAAAAGKPGVAAELIAQGLDPNAADLTGRTPLHAALTNSSLSDGSKGATAGALLTGGANPNRPDPSGITPLTLARSGPTAHPLILEPFVTSGAATATDLFVTAFVSAAQANHGNLRTANTAAGTFDPVDAERAARLLAPTLPGLGVPLATSDEVARSLRTAPVQAEMDRLNDVFAKRDGRKTDVLDSMKAKNLAKLQATLNADPRLVELPLDGMDRMALALAAIHGDTAGMAELVGPRGVAIDQRSPKGRTALHEVLSQECPKTDRTKQGVISASAASLISHGADVNARNGRGETALHLAGFRDNLAAIGMLAARIGSPNSPDPDARDNRGWTPLDTTMASTNKEAELKLHSEGLGGTAPPLKPGPLSTIDILEQAARCEDATKAPKMRKFLERVYASPELRPMLDLAAAAACNNRNPPDGGLRLFASGSNTVNSLFGGKLMTAAYDEKVNTLLFPLENDPSGEGEAVGSLAHELTHFTAHFVSNSQDTTPFTSPDEKDQYLQAITADLRKTALLDDRDPLQKHIKDRFSGRMTDYTGSATNPKPADKADEALLQEFLVGVPQVAAVYGMDALKKYLPNLAGYFENVWLPQVQASLATDPRLAAGRAKIDTAANGRAAASLAHHPACRNNSPEKPTSVPRTNPSLSVDSLMTKFETNFTAVKGKLPPPVPGGRTVPSSPAEFALSDEDKRDLKAKTSTVRSALAELVENGLPATVSVEECRDLIDKVTQTAVATPGKSLKDTLSVELGNWSRGAKTAYVERRLSLDQGVEPRELAEVIVFRSEALASSGGASTQATASMEVKAAKQKELIKKITKSLEDPANKAKIAPQKQRDVIDTMGAALAGPNAIRLKKPSASHVSIDVKGAQRAWISRLAALP